MADQFTSLASTNGRGRPNPQMFSPISHQCPSLELIPRPPGRNRSRVRIPLDRYLRFSLGPPRPKRSDAETQNRQELIKIGGACIPCKVFKKKVK